MSAVIRRHSREGGNPEVRKPISAERLLELYDRISEAPDAVSRLRRFVLDLAVRGKLVEQDPKDEPASDLQVRIRLEKDRLKKAGLLRQAQNPIALEESDLPFGLPDGWSWSQIAQLGVFSPRNNAEDDCRASFVSMSMIASEYGIAHRHEAREWGDIKKGYTHFADGDVGLAKITPCFENGKSTVFRNLTGGIGAGTTELHVLRPLLVNPDYILLFLKSPYFIETGIGKMTGTAGQKRVPRTYFANSPFPLPPLAEQGRIVARVDELMALCDRLEETRTTRESTRKKLTTAALTRLTALDTDGQTFQTHTRFALDTLPTLTARPGGIKMLRQTILDLAVRGKLVQQDLSDGYAIDALKKAGVDSPHLVTEVVTDMRDGRYDEAPYKIPDQWTWAHFPELGMIGRGRSKHRPRNDPVLFERGTHPMIQTGDVARSGGWVRTFSYQYNETGLAQSAKWPKGTLCITIAANIADSGILTFDACFPDSIVGFIPAPEFPQSSYFEYFLRTAKANLSDFAPATAQKNINLRILQSVLVPLPPPAEIERIVTRLDELMALCDRLESSIDRAERTRSRLLESVLREALQPAAK